MTREEARNKGRQLLGDRIAAGLQKLGADRVAQVYERVTGRPCGCEKRTDWLNRWDAVRHQR